MKTTLTPPVESSATDKSHATKTSSAPTYLYDFNPIKAKADFYRAVLTGGDVKKAYSGLGALPTGSENLGFGENLLPTNLSRELLV